jgi:hypothetical protein
MNDSKKSNLGAPASVIRQQLMDDEDTKTIAAAFKIPLEKYVELVMTYAQDPEKDVELTILDEDEIQQDQVDIPTQEEVMTWLEQVASGEIEIGPPQVSTKDILEKGSSASPSSKYTGSAPKPAPSSGDPFKRSLPSSANEAAGSVLKKQLKQKQNQAKLEPKNTK